MPQQILGPYTPEGVLFHDNTSLLRREAEMTLLHRHLGEIRCQELGTLPFGIAPCSSLNW